MMGLFKKEKIDRMKKDKEKLLLDSGEIIRFSPVMESKLLNKLCTILVSATNPCSEEILCYDEEDVGVLDAANVCMVVAKTVQAKRLLSRFIEKDEKDKVPELSFFSEKEENTTKYSVEYLKKFFPFFDIFDESVSISLKRDYPLLIENIHYKIILAPRVEN